eukprot:TRINITY_DN10272_c0_g1_i1.p1 TRINITY_DN10272_c0_g1~~TRINITY_DN10272_c0_g1_i1.p1  ORF type:complete len:743 (-),score=153.20 TRINITY_DN10272_c0_g1_i1:193-2421(-)
MSRMGDFYDPRQPSSWAPLPSRTPRIAGASFGIAGAYAFGPTQYSAAPPSVTPYANPSQVNTSQMNPSQMNPSQMNPSYAASAVSSSSSSHQSMQTSSSVPSQSQTHAHPSTPTASVTPRYYDVYAASQANASSALAQQRSVYTPSTPSHQTQPSTTPTSSSSSSHHYASELTKQPSYHDGAYSNVYDELKKEKDRSAQLESQAKQLNAQLDELKTTRLILDEQNKALRNQVQDLSNQLLSNNSSNTQSQASQRMIEWLQSELEIYKSRLTQETQLRVKAEQALQTQAQGQSQGQYGRTAQPPNQQGSFTGSYRAGTQPTNTAGPGYNPLTGALSQNMSSLSVSEPSQPQTYSQTQPSPQLQAQANQSRGVAVPNLTINPTSNPAAGTSAYNQSASATPNSSNAPTPSISPYDSQFANMNDDVVSPKKGVHRVLSESKLKLPKFIKNMTGSKKKKDDDDGTGDSGNPGNANLAAVPTFAAPTIPTYANQPTYQTAYQPAYSAQPTQLSQSQPQPQSNQGPLVTPAAETEARPGIRRVVSETLLSDPQSSGGSGDYDGSSKKGFLASFGHKKTPSGSMKKPPVAGFSAPPPPAHGILRPSPSYSGTGNTIGETIIADNTQPSSQPTYTTPTTQPTQPPQYNVQQYVAPAAGSLGSKTPYQSQSANPGSISASSLLTSSSSSNLTSSEASGSTSLAGSATKGDGSVRKQVRFVEDPNMQEKKETPGFYFFNPNANGGGQWGRKF